MIRTDVPDELEWPSPHWTQRSQCRRLRKLWGEVTGFDDYEGALQASMDNHLWGPVYWQALHDVAALYEPGHHRAVCGIFECLPFVLPCRKCRRHVVHLLQKFQTMLRAADSRPKWINITVCLHNAVSLRVKGPMRAKLYTLLPPEQEVSIKEALVLVSHHGLSTRVELGNGEEKDCGCREKAIEEGRVPT
jgi:hypothetical protein